MRPVARWLELTVDRQGSTLPAALLRIGIVLLLWHRFGQQMSPWMSIEPERMALATVFWVSSAVALVGWFTEVSMGVLAATMLLAFYGFGVPQLEGFGVLPFVPGWDHHHVFVMVLATVLIALSPCGRSLSVDRWLALRRGTAVPQRGPQWAIVLLMVHVACVYFWSAVDKTTPEFLSGQRLEAIFLNFYLTEIPRTAWWRPLVLTCAWGTVILEYVLPIGLFVPRLRRWLIPVGLGLHAVFYVLLPVGPFSAEMMLFYLAFLDPDAVHERLSKLVGAPV